ncbi:lipoate--protein ligase [Candidatus Formimonas warabiya]|uniref:lipoate--protein ligase n=1 Tax=Formimonas warabiya TaxID=1761012 RepID=A0A3G1KNB6_FORW1|nr:lipoate--protein ligase [Candidatus Formimonas warabiya]ATW23605.1 lipoate--protein ligase [Candidatus Formimonas warabiya]
MIYEKPKTCIYKSVSSDPWVNQALEEYLLKQCSPERIILYLWQNDKTVVIGRNQNAWKECRHLELEKDGGKLARRLSGGGAVYHDLGNLNFTFAMNKRHYDLSKQLGVVLRALNRLGLKGEFWGRNDLVIEGKKFSGNAYYFHRENALHHGTILVHCDLMKLSRYLQVSQEKIISKGVDSVRSRVVNLSEISESITLSDVAKSMEESFHDIYEGDAQPIAVDQDSFNIGPLVEKYSSWEWRFGNTPQFDISLSQRFSWGEIEIGFCLKSGYIDAVKVFSDALEERLIRDIRKSLEGCLFKKDSMLDRIKNVRAQSDKQQMVHDVTRWLEAKEL